MKASPRFALLLLTSLITLQAGNSVASEYPGFCEYDTSTAHIYAVPLESKRAYVAWSRDSTFRTPVVRIGGDYGDSIRYTGHWGKHARHHYSKDQPWNADGTLLMIDNPSDWGGGPSSLLLDGNSYAVLSTGLCSDTLLRPRDARWHPSPQFPGDRIGVYYSYLDTIFDIELQPKDSLKWVAVTSCPRCVRVRGWRLGIRPSLFGQGEGNPSFLGRWAAISTDHHHYRGWPDSIVVVDMNPPQADSVYSRGVRRVGRPVRIPASGLATDSLDYVSASASGRYIDVKYDDFAENHRIFSVDSSQLSLSPMTYSTVSSLACSGNGSATSGYILGLKHPDATIDPADDSDILVGIAKCAPSSSGEVVKVRLSDGAVTVISKGDAGGLPRENYPEHVSTRCYDRPGWAYVSYDTLPPDEGRDTSWRFNGEIVAYAIDGSGHLQRFGHAHAYEPGDDKREVTPVPSRDGTRIIFSSNWLVRTSGTVGDLDEVKDYVIDARKIPPAATESLATASLPTTTTICITLPAPVDRGVAATSYDIRYSRSEITEETFSTDSAATTTCVPGYPGHRDTCALGDLTPGTCYYVAVKSLTACDTSSALSNVICACTRREDGTYLACDRMRPDARAVATASPSLDLERPWPNPTRGLLTIRYTLPDVSPARLSVFDVAGRRVLQRTVVPTREGSAALVIRASLAPGVYVIQLTHPRGIRRRTAVVLR